MFSLKSAGGRF